MAVNPGLKSRFSTRLHFPDFSPEDAVQLLVLTLQREYSLELGAEVEGALMGLAQQVRRVTVGVLRITCGAVSAYRYLHREPVPGVPSLVWTLFTHWRVCLPGVAEPGAAGVHAT